MSMQMQSNKSVQETLSDLRKLFLKFSVEDWEPIPDEHSTTYSVRYRLAGQWVTISSSLQPTKSQNLRQCFQVISYLFLWAKRGIGGISQGVTFIHGGLVRVNAPQEDTLSEAYATIGVDPTDPIDEIRAVYHAKIRFNHPDHARDPEDKRIKNERTSRLNDAFTIIEKERTRP